MGRKLERVLSPDQLADYFFQVNRSADVVQPDEVLQNGLAVFLKGLLDVALNLLDPHAVEVFEARKLSLL
jgi:hypothetical protein